MRSLLGGAAAAALYSAQEEGLRVLLGRGFVPVVLPLVYPEPHSSMAAAFRFVDGGGRLMAVRADFTPLAVAAAGRRVAPGRPVRVAYAGEVARVNHRRLQRFQELYQLGFESLGVPEEGKAALLLALEVLQAVGLEREAVRVVVGDSRLPQWLLAQLLEESPDPQLMELLVTKDLDGLSDQLGLSAPARRALQEALWGTGRSWVRFFGMESLVEKIEEVLAAVVSMGFLGRLEVAPPLLGSYYQGLVFSLWGRKTSRVLAAGGEYVADTPGGSFPAAGATVALNLAVEELC